MLEPSALALWLHTDRSNSRFPVIIRNYCPSTHKEKWRESCFWNYKQSRLICSHDSLGNRADLFPLFQAMRLPADSQPILTGKNIASQF